MNSILLGSADVFVDFEESVTEFPAACVLNPSHFGSRCCPKLPICLNYLVRSKVLGPCETMEVSDES